MEVDQLPQGAIDRLRVGEICADTWVEDNRPLWQHKVSDLSRSVSLVDNDLDALLIGSMMFPTDALGEIVLRSHPAVIV
jgi:hypothetical protein